MQKSTLTLTAVLGLAALAATAQTAPISADTAVAIRQGLMLQMASDMGVLGAMTKGDAAYDQTAATQAANNIAAVASVLSLQQFPAGSENGKADKSHALAEIWTKPDDFLARITDLNDAASIMKDAAAKDAGAIKGSMAQLGAACSACHKAYRLPA